MDSLVLPDSLTRCRLKVRGQVQGVGFRPFVYKLAQELHLSGWVCNDGDGVEVDIEGSAEEVAEFGRRLRKEAPPLSRIHRIEETFMEPAGKYAGFEILASGQGGISTGMTIDTSVCPVCLTELFDPADRRYRYPFINCTHCGPRYTLTRAVPYDRANTTMSVFGQCPSCEQEYRDPLHRRFHAQPNCCPTCGPELQLLGSDGSELSSEDPIAKAVELLKGGKILAVKGLGGFHLVCDGQNGEAVAALRLRKYREEKPFAVMVLNGASLNGVAEVSAHAEEVLSQAERPIVLLPKLSGETDLTGIAPEIGWLGAMLPYTPLHYLLFHEWAGRPIGTDWLDNPHPAMLVVTSANPGGEPLVKDNDDALARLKDIADGFLMHNRDIAMRCDDSVVKTNNGEMHFIRRGRGYAPMPIRLSRSGPSVLALGAFLKNTFCLTRGDQAYLSQHIGDLDNASTCIALEDSIHHLLRALDGNPDMVACDRHPNFFSTHLAHRFAADRGIPCIIVQHHHAHIAAVMAEHGLEGPVLGLALDGVGYGEDGGVWGGELLHVEGAICKRVGHLSPLPMPGGDRAAREPWRMAAGALHAMGRGNEIARRFADQANAMQLQQMMAAGSKYCVSTSSAGRLFDAAAGLLGVKPIARFEGQAAMMLESLAENHGKISSRDGGYSIHEDGKSIDFLPLLGWLADCRDAGEGAALFHGTLAKGLAEWVAAMASRQQLSQVVLGGGCFLNGILSRELMFLLKAQGLEVFSASKVPPNDGGISLGQAWVAMQSYITT